MRRLAVGLATVALLASACAAEPVPPPVQHLSMRLTDSTSTFGIRLVDQLLAEPGAGNVFISPLSATILLSMAAAAAHGETRTAMLQSLGLDPTVDPSAEISATIKRLAQSDANAQLELAQAVWVKQKLPLSPAYVAKLRNDYVAQMANLDFASPDAASVVNRWVDSATHHKIDKLVERFDANTVGFLVNATYFHALWSTEFKSTAPATFHTFAGTAVSAPMMQRDESVVQVLAPDYSAALLPYKGGRFSALLMLPKHRLSAKDFSGFLTESRWNQTLQALHKSVGSALDGKCAYHEGTPDISVDCMGTLVMPKFKLDYKKDLTETLNAMGMPMPAGVPEFCGECALSQVMQKTYLEVDEKGTTAAAATGGAVTTAARLPMVVDHPFVFALIDNATDAPLFLGAIGTV